MVVPDIMMRLMSEANNYGDAVVNTGAMQQIMSSPFLITNRRSRLTGASRHYGIPKTVSRPSGMSGAEAERLAIRR